MVDFLRTFVFMSAMVIALSALAEDLPQPTGPVILEFSGNISKTNGDGKASFDRQMLVDLGMFEIKTHTPWHKDVVRFEGPKGRTILELLDVKEGELMVRALNDYVAKVPVEDFYKTDAIFALKSDGEFMGVRQKGPVFVIYPYDDYPALRNDAYYARSVWQVKAVKVD